MWVSSRRMSLQTTQTAYGHPGGPQRRSSQDFFQRIFKRSISDWSNPIKNKLCNLWMSCSLLQLAATCCSLLQLAVACCSLLQFDAACCGLPQLAAACCNLLQLGAAYCSLLRLVAACCSLSQLAAPCCSLSQLATTCCSLLQLAAACCKLLQLAAACCSLLLNSSIPYIPTFSHLHILPCACWHVSHVKIVSPCASNLVRAFTHPHSHTRTIITVLIIFEQWAANTFKYIFNIFSDCFQIVVWLLIN